MKKIYILIPKKYITQPEELWVTYDVDDICWDFVRRLCQICGIKYEDWIAFYVTDNPNLSAEQKARACAALVDVSLYYNMEFYDGIEDILKPARDFGVNVNFNSNSPRQEMIDLKKEQLTAAVPGLKDENMTFNLIIPNQPMVKQLKPNTMFFVDDNPYHLATSTAKFDVTKICPWNISREGRATLGNHPVTFLPSLRQINSFIYQRLEFYLQYGF